MMNKIILLGTLATLTACGFKGDLYLPKENDDAHFGVIQTGIDFRRPTPQTASEPINMTPK
ncbi:lipoprotein [Wielerella bovis]|nr:lipoprotein [Wielerella bovis]ULJ61116.1 lipoprotein [Wielerella bovis]ULJ62146.1 lipoprotein [Wielerella bovis]ULJ64378.1 lipoprotein [Wielerella bovis]ULJ66597.1 lipoprotein [Wielerella bovis]